MKLKDIIKTQKDIEEIGYKIENNFIEDVNINTIAYFGNVTCFVIRCSNVSPMSSYNNTGNLGYILKAFIEMFELSIEDGVYLTDIKNIPCRLVFDGDKCVGFGHFMKDKFVLTEEFAKIYT